MGCSLPREGKRKLKGQCLGLALWVGGGWWVVGHPPGGGPRKRSSGVDGELD